MVVVCRNLSCVVFLLASAACIDLVGLEAAPCSEEGLCTSGLACVDGTCIDGVVACTNRCGDVGGIDCGGCSGAGEVCDPLNQCRVPRDRLTCGEDLGIACGTCAGDEFCNGSRRCEKICEGRCGTVMERDCGGCPGSGVCLQGSCVAALDCTQNVEMPESTDPFSDLSRVQTAVPFTAYEPMCAGYVVVATINNEVIISNIWQSDTPSHRYAFSQSIRTMLLQVDLRILWVVLGPEGRLVRIDLADGRTAESGLGPLRVALGTTHRLLANSPTTLMLTESVFDAEGKVFVVDPQNLTLVESVDIPLFAREIQPAFNQDLLIATTSVAAVLYDYAPQAPLTERERIPVRAPPFSVSPDGRELVLYSSTSLDEYLLSDPAQLVGRYGSSSNRPRSVQHSAGGRWLVVASNQLIAYDRATLTRALRPGSGYNCFLSSCFLTDVRMSPDGQIAFAVSDGDLLFSAALPPPSPSVSV